ncbi:MAG: membrane protein insertase YidC [Candidatus Zixiibacteriota bacterium]|nr:MAG: membrane protein insertase YidC [candidate division Zixibacteria bacterium]
MDRKTIVLVVLLVVVLIFYFPIMEFLGLYKPAPPEPQESQPPADTTTQVVRPESVPTEAPPTAAIGADTAVVEAPVEEEFVRPDTIVVETNKYLVTLTTAGGGPVSMKLKEYDYRNDVKIEMMPEAVVATPELSFAGGQFTTSTVNFTCDRDPRAYDATRDQLDITYAYQPAAGGKIVRHFRFYPDEYHYELFVEVIGPGELGFDRQYYLVWNTPLGVTEPQPKIDYDAMQAVAMQAGSRESLDDFDDGKLDQSLTGNTTWAGIRSKYFAAVMIPTNRHAESVFAQGEKRSIDTRDGEVEQRLITVGMEMPFTAMTTSFADSFTVFVGPLDYLLMADYNVGLEDMLDIGTAPFVGWIIKPFAIAIIWLLPKMYDVIPNYGLVIILFALLVKLITMPLSMKSFKSMNAMKELQPKIEELKKRHKNNPQAMNQEMMKLYKQHGVNPLSGCLPILPQMPLLFAMFSVFRSTILLRDAPFVWFIADLSHGATGLTDPYIIMVVIMIVAQFVSQKFTMASTQQNKALLYIMPLFMGFIFYSLSAGLILYWTCFSVFSLIDYFAFKRRKNSEVKTAK